MNILLVKSTGLTYQNFSVTQPLGLMYLASYLRNNLKDVNIKILDTRIFKDYRKELVNNLKVFNPSIVGISAVTMEANSMHEIAGIVKEMIPGSYVIAGGPHPTSFLRRTLEDRNIDYVVKGEGEVTFYELVKTLSEGDDVSRVRGIAFRKNGDLIQTEQQEFIKNLDSVPFPAWDLIDVDAYRKFYSMSPRGKRRYMVIYTSRACPYQCIYCHNMFGKKFRARSPENVIGEIDILYNKYGIKELEVVDDIFNLDVERAERICDMIIERRYDLRIAFPNGLRSDRLDKHLLEKMRRAGTVFISFAIESASPRIQKLIKKNLRIEKAKEAIENAVRLGIFSNGFFMLGFPTETEEEVRETIRFAVGSNLHSAYFFIVTPHEGTELFEMVPELKTKKVPFDDYSYLRTYFQISNVGEEKLFRLWHSAYLRFYFTPTRWPRWIYSMLRNNVNILTVIRMISYAAFQFLHRILIHIKREFHKRN